MPGIPKFSDLAVDFEAFRFFHHYTSSVTLHGVIYLKQCTKTVGNSNP
jgi:hypothetical protein